MAARALPSSADGRGFSDGAGDHRPRLHSGWLFADPRAKSVHPATRPRNVRLGAMTRFFFSTDDGEYIEDRVGTLLPDIPAAVRQGQMLAAELLPGIERLLAQRRPAGDDQR
jgi:hypothetical protein